MARNRKHIRLRNYDYSRQNAYFITICTKERKSFFCKNVPVHIPVWDPATMLSPPGQIAEQMILEIPQRFPHVFLDEYTVMPNHVHCILVLDYTNANVATANSQQTAEQLIEPRFNEFGNPVKGSVSVIINQFKGVVKKWCNNNNHSYFNWQSRFHDHVIRDVESHEKIRQYIINNARNWCDDKFYYTPPQDNKKGGFAL